MKTNIAIIVSGGSGVRMHSDIPKQYISVAGKTILEHCVAKFIHHPLISGIIVVAHTYYIDTVEELMNDFRKIKHVEIVCGGAQRYHSVYQGLLKAEAMAPDGNVLIHDAVRPNVDETTINGVVEALSEYEAACPLIAVADTVMQLKEGFQPKPLNRSEIKLVQTPQGFRLDKILFAYREFFSQSNIEPTDDASIYLRYAFNADLAVTKGNPENFKITFPGDISRFEQLFSV